MISTYVPVAQLEELQPSKLNVIGSSPIGYTKQNNKCQTRELAMIKLSLSDANFNVWFTGCTHFGHKNIIKYCNRPFANIKEHDEQLIYNWNLLVTQNDYVFHLGDFGLAGKEYLASIIGRLKGKIFICFGNHDSVTEKLSHLFAGHGEAAEITVNNQLVCLNHYAPRIWNKCHYGSWALYSHSHNSLPQETYIQTGPGEISKVQSKSIDVGIDAVAMQLAGKSQGEAISETSCDMYTPINFTEVKAILDQFSIQKVDHH